jgi:hypothetical protein
MLSGLVSWNIRLMVHQTRSTQRQIRTLKERQQIYAFLVSGGIISCERSFKSGQGLRVFYVPAKNDYGSLTVYFQNGTAYSKHRMPRYDIAR